MPMSPRLLRPRAASNFDPRAISGLGLWLDASNTSSLTFNGNTVSEWRDLSGNARHYSQSTAAQQPNGTARTLGGRRVLDFADGQALAGNAAARGMSRNIGAITMFVVAGVDSMTQPPAGGIRVFWVASGGTGLGRSAIFYRTATFADGTLEVGARRIDSDSFTSFGYAANTNANVLSGIIDYANSDAFIYQNGTLRASELNFLTSGSTSDTDATWTSIGASSDATGAAVNNQLDGFVGEVCVYPRALSSQERQAVERYLGAKWGITLTSPPAYADADVNAYINAVEAADQNHLETGVRDAINDFVVGCKADGIWSAIKSSCILMGARTLSGALTPLVGTAPTNQNFVSGDYNRETGLIGDGATKYLHSNRANNADPQNDFHMATHHSTSGRMMMGAGGFPVNGSSLFFGGDGGTHCRSSNSVTVGAGAGFTGVSRSSSAEFSVRRITSDSTASLTSSAPSSDPLLVFARFSNGNAASFSNQRCTFYSIGTSLSLPLLGQRVGTLYTAIGAAIP